jgi:hypothetical protein
MVLDAAELLEQAQKKLKAAFELTCAIACELSQALRSTPHLAILP